LGFSFQPSARLNAVEIAVDIDLQQDRRVISRTACVSGNSAVKTQGDQVEFVDENVDYTHWIGVADVIVEALGKQGALTPMFTLNKALHGRSLR
jgi:hypothetical protein